METIPEHKPCVNLRSTFDFNLQLENDGQFVFSALRKGDSHVVLRYLELGGDANISNRCGQSLLHVAAHKGLMDVAKELLRRACVRPINLLPLLDKYNRTAAHYACLGGHRGLLSFLAYQGEETSQHTDVYDCTLAHLATVSGCRETLSCALDLNPGALNARDRQGRTCLLMAVQAGYAELCTFLLARGARADLGDTDGWTPLHEAAAKGKGSAVRFINILPLTPSTLAATDTYNHTPLHVACKRSSSAAAVAVLLAAGADPLARVACGTTCLHIAVWQGDAAVVAVLLASTAKLAQTQLHDVADVDGDTPLHWAAFRGHKNVVDQLLTAGANPKHLNGEGMLPGGLFAENVPDGTRRWIMLALAAGRPGAYYHCQSPHLIRAVVQAASPQRNIMA